jgi:RHS repeat-associated protein
MKGGKMDRLPIRRTILALTLIAGGVPVSAQGPNDEPQRDAFLSKVKSAIELGSIQESFNPYSGQVVLRIPTVNLPTRGGMGTTLTAYYNSEIWNRTDLSLHSHVASIDTADNLGGGGWQLHFGKIFNPNGLGSPNETTIDNPLFVAPDGSTRAFYNSIEWPGDLVSEDRWRYHKVDSTTWTITTAAGWTYTCSTAAGVVKLSLRGEDIAQCTRYENPHGLAWTVTYASGKPESVTDASSRTIDIVYWSGTDRIRYLDVEEGTTLRQRWTFTYSSSAQLTWAHPGGSRTVYSLTSIDPPVGDDWSFTYKSSSTALASGRYMLSTATLPTGGTITYTWSGKSFNVGCQSGNTIQKPTLASRATAGRDVTSGTWNYGYANPGSDGMTTTVTGPTGSGYSETHVSEGYGSFAPYDGSIWSIGRLRSKTVSDAIQDVEDVITLEEGELLSNDWRVTSGWANCGQVRRDSGIRFVKPLTTTRTTTRGTTTWETESSNFDDYGNPGTITETGNVSRTTTLTWWYSTTYHLLDGRISCRSQVPGERARFWYTTLGKVSAQNLNPTSCMATDGVHTAYTYDTAGQLLSEITTNTNGTYTEREKRYENYAYGTPRKEIIDKGTGGEIWINREMTFLGTVDWEEDGRRGADYRTDFTYDSWGRLTGIDPPVGHATTVSYATDGSTVTYTRGSTGDQRRTRYAFDGFGRLREWQDLERADRVLTSYDNLGRKNWEALYLGGVAGDVRWFDDAGRLTLVDHPDGTAIDYAYSGNSVTITDEALENTVLGYQAFGSPEDKRLRTVFDARGNTWTYGYHASYGKLTGITAPGGSSPYRTFTWTTRRFLDEEDHNETGVIDYGWSAAGDRMSRVKGGATVQYSYDKAGRMTSINPATTAYDVAIGWNDASLRTGLDNAEVDYTFSWDRAKRLDWLSAAFPTFSRTVDFSYDSHDRLTTITYPSGRQVVYGYDAKGRVSLITAPGATDYVSSITYKAHGGVDTITYGNGATSVFSYDTRLRPTFLATQGPDLDVDYDPASRIDSWATTGGVARSFGYDQLGRLTSATGPRGEAISFTYTNGGSRLTQTIDGVADTYGYTSDRLTSVTGGNPQTFGYDTAGRMTSRGSSTFTWSPLDRMVTATVSGTSAAYGHDGDGFRVRSTVAGVSRYFLHDGSGRILAEYDGSGNLLIEHIYLGDRRIASRQADGTRSYVQHDVLGSSWIVTQVSSAGTYAEWDYWPFGEPVSQFDLQVGMKGVAPDALCADPDDIFCDGFESGNLLAWTCTNGQSGCVEPDWELFEPLFTGKKRDELTDLLYFEARHLDPKIGRFVSPDEGPFVLENPQTFNRYAYALSSPLKYKDPDGNVADTILDIGFVAYDLFDIGRSLFRGDGVSGVQLAALGADVGGAFIPFATGGGLAVRAAAHGDDAIKGAARLTELVSDAATHGPEEGITIFRVWGDDAAAWGRSWTTVDPRTVENFRDAAGLPNQNSGRFVSEGILRDPTGVQFKAADPLHGNRGGLPEVVVPNPAGQIDLTNVQGLNPEL